MNLVLIGKGAEAQQHFVLLQQQRPCVRAAQGLQAAFGKQRVQILSGAPVAPRKLSKSVRLILCLFIEKDRHVLPPKKPCPCHTNIP